jgi:hypothetical protein
MHTSRYQIIVSGRLALDLIGPTCLAREPDTRLAR